jgi:MFS family permease
MMPSTFRRSRHTWLLYLAYAVYGYVLNSLGPATPFLKSELNLTYTVASLHFSAFAIGMILAGLSGHLAVARKGRKWVLWFALLGMSLSALGLVGGRSAWITIGAAFLMGIIGSLISSVVPSGLADEHGENRAIALTELNLVAAVGSATAALAIGWFSYTFLSWRFAFALPLLIALVLWLDLGRTDLTAGVPANQWEPAAAGGLPQRFWFYWLALILVVSIEYCMVFWSADYLENAAGLSKSAAAQAVSLFQAGMILGRLSASRLLRRFSSFQLLTASLLIAAGGFLLYWIAQAPGLVVLGLLITGLGVASIYPMSMALALGAAGGRTVQASTRAGLASGIAIFTLPLVLGRLADALGIRQAYGVVVVLLVAAFALIQFTQRTARRANFPG